MKKMLCTALALLMMLSLTAFGAADEKVNVTEGELTRVSFLKTPQEVMAVFGYDDDDVCDTSLPLKELCLALDDVQDPGNLGTIIRLADWFGITDIVCSRSSADCFNPKVVQATMGAILRVKVHYVDLERFLHDAAAEQIPRYGTFLEGENLYTTQLGEGGIIIMGNEGRGISRPIEQLVSHKLLIPAYPANRPTSESLNVAMATGIVCAEFRRRAAEA